MFAADAISTVVVAAGTRAETAPTVIVHFFAVVTDALE